MAKNLIDTLDPLTAHIIGPLITEAWQDTAPPPGASSRTIEDRLRLLQADLPNLVDLASILRTIAGRVLEASTPDAIAARAEAQRQAEAARVRAQQNAPHLRAMERQANQQSREEQVRTLRDKAAQMQVLASEAEESVRKANSANPPPAPKEMARLMGLAKAARAAAQGAQDLLHKTLAAERPTA